MTTADLLTRSVMVAGEMVQPQVVTLGDYSERIAKTAAKLRTDDEKAILKIARAAKGTLPLINIATAITAGGAGPHGFPRLAIAPYEWSIDSQRLWVRVSPNGSVEFSDGKDWGREWDLELPEKTLPKLAPWPIEAWTIVPLVPLELRQKNPNNVVLLYEVDDWKIARMRELDPYLLRRVAGSVYAVIGTWDITERELKAYQAARNLGIR